FAGAGEMCGEIAGIWPVPADPGSAAIPGIGKDRPIPHRRGGELIWFRGRGGCITKDEPDARVGDTAPIGAPPGRDPPAGRNGRTEAIPPGPSPAGPRPPHAESSRDGERR